MPRVQQHIMGPPVAPYHESSPWEALLQGTVISTDLDRVSEPYVRIDNGSVVSLPFGGWTTTSSFARP